MDKERIDGFRSAFAPGETLFWQVPAAARERMAFYSENLPRLFSEKITAVFAVSDHYALEFMRFLQGQGIRVPEDVQIIGFDDTLASRESVPALTTIHQIRMRRSGQGLPSAALKPCGTAPPAMPASFCRWSWWNGKAQGGCHVRLYEDPLQNRHSGLPSKGSKMPAHRGDLDTVGGRFMFIFRVQRRA